MGWLGGERRGRNDEEALPRAELLQKMRDLQNLADLENILIRSFLLRVKAIDSKGGSVYLKMRKRP